MTDGPAQNVVGPDFDERLRTRIPIFSHTKEYRAYFGSMIHGDKISLVVYSLR